MINNDNITKVYTREAAPWPLPISITKIICLLAGRETSAALRIALAYDKLTRSRASAAHEAVFHEPFTYWDWHGVEPDDADARDYKRQKFWEHQRGFVVNGTTSYGYPTNRERWHRFKQEVRQDEQRRTWVKRIAVASWMEAKDLLWIAENLTTIEGLDLSDIPVGNLITPTDWTTLLHPNVLRRGALSKLLPTLLWLGIPHSRFSAFTTAHALIKDALPCCTNLRTLSIREQSSGSDLNGSAIESDDDAYRLPFRVAQQAPKTVATLELRMYYPSLDRLMSHLKTTKSSIKHIGIDFGAWVQEFHYPRPEEHGHGQLEAMNAGRAAAQKDRFKAYEQSHNEVFAPKSKWWLPKSELDVGSPKASAGTGCQGDDWLIEKVSCNGRKYAIERDFFSTGICSKSIVPVSYSIGHGERRVSTLPAMLNNLYETASKHPEIKLFSLAPEWQKKSTDPVHPLALLQIDPSSEAAVFESVLPDAYAWLEKTFMWRPVFDWDWFVNPDPYNTEMNLPEQYESLRGQWKLTSTEPALSTCDELVVEIANQFRMLRDAKIPVHLLIGRREYNGSSLYWGWPYDPFTWSEWLKKPFDANLRLIAPLIDTLTISYNLRNPLDEDHLENIDVLEPEIRGRGNAVCPRPLCPWKDTDKECPFGCQEKPFRTRKPSNPEQTQKMANKKAITPFGKYKAKLASQLLSNPPPGEYAQDWRAEDEDTDDDDTNATTHETARHAAFKREAVGWQMFWKLYAPKLIRLSELRVRMPRCFDRVGSVRLAKLLVPEKHWHMRSFANERQHMQTLPDIARSWNTDGRFRCALESKVWPAGRFVRRTWLRVLPGTTSSQAEAGKKVFGGMEDKAHLSAKNNNASEDNDEAKIEAREQEELQKAIDRAAAATTAAQAKEDELGAKQYRSPSSFSQDNPENAKLSRLLTGLHGRRMRRAAKQAWRQQLQAYIDELAPVAEEAGVGPVCHVLRRTLNRMEARVRGRFRVADVFVDRSDEGSGVRKGVGLRKDRLRYMSEEDRRREGPVEMAGVLLVDGKEDDCDSSDSTSLRNPSEEGIGQMAVTESPLLHVERDMENEDVLGDGDDPDPDIQIPGPTTEDTTEELPAQPGTKQPEQQPQQQSSTPSLAHPAVTNNNSSPYLPSKNRPHSQLHSSSPTMNQANPTTPPNPSLDSPIPSIEHSYSHHLFSPSGPDTIDSVRSPPAPAPTTAPKPRKRRRIDPVLDTRLADHVIVDMTQTGRTRRSATPGGIRGARGEGSEDGRGGGDGGGVGRKRKRGV